MSYQQARLCWCKNAEDCADAMRDCYGSEGKKYCGYPIYIQESIKKDFFYRFSKLEREPGAVFFRKLRSRKPVFLYSRIWQN